MKSQPRYIRDNSYLYALGSHPGYYFEVGRAAGQQRLWGLCGDAAYVLRFDSDGVLTHVERVAVSSGADSGDLPGILHSLSSRLRGEWSLRDEPILITRFWLDQANAGIEDLGTI